MIKMSDVNDIISASINPVKFQVMRDKTAGRMNVSVTVKTKIGEESDKFTLPLVAVWVGQDNMAVRAWASVRSHKSKILAEIIQSSGFIRTGDRDRVLSYANGVIRYGSAPGCEITSQDDNYNTKTYYDNKAKLLKAVISAVSSYYQVVGFDNLAAIPDIIVRQFGFEEVKDYFGRAESMWLASPGSILRTDGDYESRSVLSARALKLLKVMQYVVEKRDLTELKSAV
jgi:hypothetical protein